MTIKMKELPNIERPYEKLELYGEKNLSNSELLAIIIKNGTREESALTIAQKVIGLRNAENTNSLRFLQELSIQDLIKIKGIGKVKAIQIIAVCELARRISMPIDTEKIIIKTPKDIATIFMDEMKLEKREILKVILLNTKNIIQKICDISIGGTNSVIIEPKDILREAIRLGIPKIIMLHNHPSGDPTPSTSDINMTKRIEEASNIIGIQLLDHIVIGDGKYYSIFSNR